MNMKHMNSKKLLIATLICFTASASAIALAATNSSGSPQQTLSPETQEDIAKHRTIAAAHEATAKCLESGKSDEYCEGQLQSACKGIAIGRFCGMKH